MGRPAATSQDTKSDTTNATSYTGTAGKSWTSGRLYLLCFFATSSSTLPDPTVTLSSGGQSWTKKQTDGTTNKTGVYWFIPGSNLTDAIKVDFGATTASGIDFVVIEVTGMYKGNAGGGAGAFNLSAVASGTSTTPSASLASAPASNSLTLGFAAQLANAGFTVGANFTTKIETAGHNSPAARAALEIDSGTAQQTANWTITSASWFAYAIEIVVANIAIGLVTETDTSQTMGRSKSLAVGLVTETDTSQTMGRSKSKAVGLVSETDASVSMGVTKSAAIGLVTETDAALNINRLVSVPVGLVTETDAAEPIAPVHQVAIGLVTETDSARTIGSRKSLAIGPVTETDSARTITVRHSLAIGAVLETDSARTITVHRTVAIGGVLETDEASALTLRRSVAIDAVLELDTAASILVVGGLEEGGGGEGESVFGSRSFAPGGLQIVRHQLVAPDGQAFIIRLGEWEAFESAAGGYMSASGRTDGTLLDRFPRAFDGGQLRSFFGPTGECLWAGEVLGPVRLGGSADVIARGHGLLADKTFSRLLWQNGFPGDWFDMTADPLGAPANEDKFTVDISDGRVKVSVAQGTDFDGGEEHGAAFDCGTEVATRIAFTLKAKEANAQWSVRIYGGSGLTYDAATWEQIGSTISLTSYTDPIEVDELIDTEPNFVAIALHRGGSVTGGQAFWIRASNIRVNGRAAEDDYSASAIARDLFGLLGVSTLGVAELGTTALPRDDEAKRASEVLGELAALVDGSWGILDTGAMPFGSFRRWDAEMWSVPTARGMRLVSQARFDSVTVPFRTANPKVNGTKTIAAPYRLPVSRDFQVDFVADTEEQAELVAAALAPHMVSERFAGDATLSEAFDPGGNLWSAHRLKAGVSLRVPGYAEPLRISEIRRTDHGVDVTFPDSTDRIASIVARTLRAAA